jgi:thymidine kinase
MGSGKTARLIELAEQVPVEKRIVVCQTKGELMSQPFIQSRNGKRIECDSLTREGYRLAFLSPRSVKEKVTHVFIDEIQFPGYGLGNLLRFSDVAGLNVVFAGVDKDYHGIEYDRIERIMNKRESYSYSVKRKAAEIEYLHAICAVTGSCANYSELLTDHESTRKEDYRAVCGEVFRKSKHCRI